MPLKGIRIIIGLLLSGPSILATPSKSESTVNSFSTLLCVDALSMVRSHRFVPLNPEFAQAARADLSSKAALQQLMQGFPIVDSEGRATEFKLKGFWFRDLNLVQSSEELAAQLDRFSSFVKEAYAQDKRLHFSPEELELLTWEDLSFHQHQGWVFIEDEKESIMKALRIYSFDYKDTYARYSSMQNDLQIYLPMERRRHMANFGNPSFASLFTHPPAFFREELHLRNLLRANLAIEPSDTDHLSQDSLRIPPKKMTPAQIKKALEIHRKYQLAELTRYARNPLEKKSGQLSFQHLLRGMAILMEAENIESARLEASTRIHRSYYATALKETPAESLLASPEEGGSFFSVSLAELRDLGSRP